MIDPETKAYIDQQLRFYQRIRDERAAPDRSIVARYTTAAGQTIADNTITIVDFGTKARDTHNCVTTGASWKFTAVYPGDYPIDVAIMFASTTAWALGEHGEVLLYRNGADYSRIDLDGNMDSSAGALYKFLSGSDTVYLDTGDYCDVRVLQVTGGNLALHNSGLFNRVSISLRR